MWFSAVLLFGPAVNLLPTLLMLLAELIGVGLGWAAIFKARGRTVSGWLGVLLNCLPVWAVFFLWLWLISGHRLPRL